MHWPAHIAEDVLELYALGRLSEAESTPIEEHLLLCPDCQDALAATDELISALKSVMPSEAAGRG